MLDEIVLDMLMCRFILDLLIHLEELLQQLRITMLVVLRVQHLGNGTFLIVVEVILVLSLIFNDHVVKEDTSLLECGFSKEITTKHMTINVFIPS